METRMERRKRERRKNRIRFYKFIILFTTLIMLSFGIKIVNDNIVYLDYFNNPVIFKINFKEKKLNLFGKAYLIDLKVLKRDY